MPSPRNAQVAEKLREAAALLEDQGASAFRSHAYRRAADTVDALDRDVGDLLEAEGRDGLIAPPAIGESIAAAIDEMHRTGRWGQLDRLRGAADPEILFRTPPGLGSRLTQRAHGALHVDTLEALEITAHDGRLAAVPGFGLRRVALVRAALEAGLGRLRRNRPPGPALASREPPVTMLLDVDGEYREKAAAGRLKTIAPRRFNPDGRAWLPVLHGERTDWHFTVLFSNTALAHELGRVRDWVVIYFYDGDHREGHWTVVTETRVPLAGRRVVRGREPECLRHYADPEAR